MWTESLPVDDVEVEVDSVIDDLPTTPGLPPDGGLEAWTQVLAAHLIQINTWGMANSFGIFEEYYVRAGLESTFKLAWIGSLQIFLIYAIGPFSGRALDYGWCRITLLGGAVFQLLGIFLASASSKYWQLILTQGVLVGLGNGLVFCPIIALVSTFFLRNRALALACVTAGASTGGIILPLIAERLIYRIGFPWTMRIMGFVMLFDWCVALALMKPRIQPRKLGPLVDLSAFKEMPYTWLCIGGFLNLLAAYYVYYYISTFSRDIIGVSSSTAFILSLILNGVGVPGRIIPSLLADRYFGAFNVYISVTVIGSALLYSWTAVHDTAGLYSFGVLYGVFGAAVQGLFLACSASLTTDLQKMGTRTGMIFSIVSISCLIGSPTAGRLIEVGDGSYVYAQVFGASALAAGAIALTTSRVSKTGFILKRKI